LNFCSASEFKLASCLTAPVLPTDGPKCTDMCKLKTCENQKFDYEGPALDMHYSDESDDEDHDTE